MSLVNDMLRDLDQRRRESEGPAARVRLTPAGDYPRQGQRNWVPIIVSGLAIFATGLGFAWMQMNGSNSTQELAVAIVPSSVIDTNEETAAPVESIVSAPVMPSAAAAPIAAAPSLDEEFTETPAQDQLVVLAELAAANSDTVVPESRAVESLPAETPTPEVTANPVVEIRQPAVTANIINQPAASQEPIKDLTAPSAEQRDTLAVQEALRLIADNQPAAAYSRLEQNLLDNPFAHQSRETYAKFLMNDGDSHSAGALMDSGLQIAPNHSGFKKVKARILIADGNIQSAVSLLESRAPAVAQDPEYHEILASAQLAVRDFDGAVLSYTGLVQRDQTQGRWWYGFAAAQDALGNTTAARQAYSRAIEKPNLSTNLRRRSQDRLSVLSQ